MEYFAETNHLARTLKDERAITKAYGKDRGQRIQQRLAEFKAATTLMDIPVDPPPRCHRLKGNRRNQFAVNISANYRMVFEGYDKNDRLTTKKSEIVTVQITSIEDYH